MSSGFSTAADWLGNITGVPKNTTFDKKESDDPVLRDLRAMKDEEMKGGVYALPPPKNNAAAAKTPKYNSSKAHQPKPKFVAHKDPTRGKKGKEKVQSNRLGQVVS